MTPPTQPSNERAVAVPYVNLPLQFRRIKPEVMAAIERVLESGAYVLGPEVEQFERAFAEFCGSRYAVGVNSGMDALFLTLRALGVGPGDEVITAPNSFVATASAIAMTGARPVFVDVRDDLNLDPALIEKAVTPKTRGILPVHLAGNPADMDPILEIGKRRGLWVIEDAAQSVGALHRGRRVGSLGRAGCFSLHPLKNLHAFGDAGVVTTDDERLAQALRKIRNHGLKNRDECEFWGFNSRLDTIQAAVLLVKLKHLDAWTEERRSIARRYDEGLKGVVTLPKETPGCKSVSQTYVIQADRRDELIRHLKSCGVDAKVHYAISLFQQESASGLGYAPAALPVAARLAGRIASLPLFPEMSEDQISAVVQGVRSFYR